MSAIQRIVQIDDKVEITDGQQTVIFTMWTNPGHREWQFESGYAELTGLIETLTKVAEKLRKGSA